MSEQKTGIELIAQERKEQIEKHGYTIEDDASINHEQQMAIAAMRLIDGRIDYQDASPYDWSENQWRKMFRKPYKDRLIIAGALIAAEIDRIQSKDL